ncbi:helix-turn-helix transcriptional regulator [Salininema proteolyticum]|uniref:Helix-turn-helix transcriptional regulator n=1 Tax=Salininema proteolyticum TaxID=1607685 RepID=A0ABV8TUC7_9ACTN
MRRKEMAEFLRERRARLTPAEAGLAVDGRPRRVPGLRRDEAARSANISVEYYTRLEQGRVGNPSDEVMASVADALHLTESEREHLDDLRGRARDPDSGAAQRVRPGLLATLHSLQNVPAFIVGRRLDVLAYNRLAKEVIADFDAMPAVERNMARLAVLDREAAARLVTWDKAVTEMAATLRMEAGRRPGDRRLAQLIAELRRASPSFERLWNEKDVLRKTHGHKAYRHPEVGGLEFDYELFPAPGDADQTLVVYNAAPGSHTEESLRLLQSWTAPPARERR